MKFQRIVQALYFQPWSITHESWLEISRIVKPYISGTPLPSPRADGLGFFGQPLPAMKIEFDTATIPIIGPLVQHASLIEKMCGACSYDDVRKDLKQATETPGVSRIRLVIDSPGGQCVGNIECARAISDLAQFMDVEAVCDGQACSAAYALACGARRFVCTPSAIIGSVGAFVAIEDSSKLAEMAGLKIDVIKDGDLKGAGIPGTALSAEQRSDLLKMVSKYAAMFREHVNAFRMIAAGNLNGAVFVGQDALEAGFVDEIVEDIDYEFEEALTIDDDVESEAVAEPPKTEQPINITVNMTQEKKSAKAVIKRDAAGRMTGIEEGE